MDEEKIIKKRQHLELETGACHWVCSKCEVLTPSYDYEMVSGLCRGCL